jgi:asparagine synthase (glutamine-hydrolysing)
MCGLSGILSLSGRPIADAERRIRRMTALVRHRGPDAEGVLVSDDGLCALGNTRLAITDPGAPIELPLRSNDGKAAISFNGEIYDYREVRRELEGRGVRFRHHTDTEVLIEGLRLHGESLLERLDGMWALAYYDFEARRLLLSRDILGERHIFYRVENQELVFCSEPMPVLADAGRPEDVDFDGLVTALRYYSAPPGRTIVKGLRRLLPGHNLVARPGEGWREQRYRRLHPEKWFDFFRGQPSLDHIIERFEEVMSRVSLRRLPPDVPFISTLSGGLDSAAVCIFGSDQGKKQIRTLFGQSAEQPARNHPDELDEYEASQVTSRRLNTQHKHIHMNNDDCVPVLERLAVNGFDGMIDPGAAPFEMLAWQVRRDDTKVMLISDGPDELLGGYPVDRRAWEIDRLRAGARARYGLMKAASATRLGRGALRRLGRRRLTIPPDVGYRPFHFVPQHQAASPDYLRRILSPEQVAASGSHYGVMDPTYDELLPELDYTQYRALSYAAVSLPEMFNLRTDKSFLRAAIECRLPFQAPEMAEFQIAVPAAMRFGAGDTTKFLLRQIVERRVGAEVAQRSKHGFSAPLFGTPSVRAQLNFEETIAASPIFADLPFAPGTREVALDPRFGKLTWPFFVLAKTYEQLRTGRYVLADAASTAAPATPARAPAA